MTPPRYDDLLRRYAATFLRSGSRPAVSSELVMEASPGELRVHLPGLEPLVAAVRGGGDYQFELRRFEATSTEAALEAAVIDLVWTGRAPFRRAGALFELRDELATISDPEEAAEYAALRLDEMSEEADHGEHQEIELETERVLGLFPCVEFELKDPRAFWRSLLGSEASNVRVHGVAPWDGNGAMALFSAGGPVFHAEALTS
ncbi:MAG: hypothetical protein AAFU79_31375 [Myxococcota bacterium]